MPKPPSRTSKSIDAAITPAGKPNWPTAPHARLGRDAGSARRDFRNPTASTPESLAVDSRRPDPEHFVVKGGHDALAASAVDFRLASNLDTSRAPSLCGRQVIHNERDMWLSLNVAKLSCAWRNRDRQCQSCRDRGCIESRPARRVACHRQLWRDAPGAVISDKPP